MTIKKALLERLEQLEDATNEGAILVYADEHTEKAHELKTILDAVCATPGNGLVRVIFNGSDNNLFNAMIESRPWDEVEGHDERGTCDDDSERPDGSSPSPLAAGGEVCEAECEPVELCVEKPRNLI